MASVLIVDDDAEYGEVLKLALVQRGFIVRTARTPAEAISQEEELRPDVLVVDFRLESTVNGVQLARLLRSKRPGLTVIVIPAYFSEAVRGGASEISFAVIPKPFEVEELIDAIERALSPRANG